MHEMAFIGKIFVFIFLIKSVSLKAKGNGSETTWIGSSVKWTEPSFCSKYHALFEVSYFVCVVLLVLLVR